MRRWICLFIAGLCFAAAFPYSISKSDFNAYIDSMGIKDRIAQRFFVYAPQHIHFATEPGGIIPSVNVLKGLLEGTFDKDIGRYTIPPFIGIDQEGGKVNRFYFISDFPSMYDLAHKGQDSIIFYLTKQCSLMKKSHINVNFSPVVDLSILNGSNMNRMGRNISRRPDSIILFASHYMDVHKEQRILTTLKHFPGYGNTYYNSDADIYNYKGSIAHFLNEYAIFLSLSKKADFIMISNLIYPFLDSVPAIMSPAIVSLAQQYSNCIVLTDDIACKAYDNPFHVLRSSISAGNDMFILMDHTLFEPMVDSMYKWYASNKMDSMETFRGIKKIILKKEYLFRIISDNR